MAKLSKDQRRKQKLAKRKTLTGIPPSQAATQGRTPAEQKAFVESNEWLEKHTDELLATAWLIRKEGLTGFVQLNWGEAKNAGIPVHGVSFESAEKMREALQKAGYPESVRNSLVRNATVADANPSMANVLIVYSDTFTRTIVVGDQDRTLQQVFESDAERYLAKISGTIR